MKKAFLVTKENVMYEYTGKISAVAMRRAVNKFPGAIIFSNHGDQIVKYGTPYNPTEPGMCAIETAEKGCEMFETWKRMFNE